MNQRVVAAAALIVAGCGRPGPALHQPVGQTTVTSAEQTSASGYVPPSIELYLAGQHPGPCGMDRLPSISFAFASTELDERADLELEQLATCLRQGTFEAARIVLVGRADPVGPSRYNLGLAYGRAERVKARLVALGIPGERIVVTSAGESEVTRDRWGEARRVDIVIARPTAATAPAAPRP